MLTIKHIGTDGTETILEAERIEVVRGKGRFEDGIFIDPDDGCNAVIGADRARKLEAAEGEQVDPLAAVVAPIVRAWKHVIHFVDARSSDDVEPVVYIMNRFGATVATYRL